MRAMAMVFGLLAATLADAAVPPCNPDDERVFADVPTEHPLCGPMEELYRRGGTSGCRVEDGVLYFCPEEVATRAQAAAFAVGAQAADPFAQITASGEVRFGVGAVSAESLSMGVYRVEFDRNVQRCAVFATALDGEPGIKVVAMLTTDPVAVYVFTTKNDSPRDTPFDLALRCAAP